MCKVETLMSLKISYSSLMKSKVLLIKTYNYITFPLFFPTPPTPHHFPLSKRPLFFSIISQ